MRALRQAVTRNGEASTHATGNKRPKRFYASITLNPDKAGLQVAKIAEVARPGRSASRIS